MVGAGRLRAARPIKFFHNGYIYYSYYLRHIFLLDIQMKALFSILGLALFTGVFFVLPFYLI